MRASPRFWFVRPCRTKSFKKLSSGCMRRTFRPRSRTPRFWPIEAIFQREEKDWDSCHGSKWPEKRDVGTTPRASPTASPWRSRAFAATAAVKGEEEEEPKPRTTEYDELPQDSPHASEPARSEAPVGPKSTHDVGAVPTSASFVLDVLRGWRLLQAASLSRDEWRDVLSSTGNKLDFESVSNALQVLWDDQLLHSPASGPSYQLHWMEDSSPHVSRGDDESSWWDDSCLQHWSSPWPQAL